MRLSSQPGAAPRPDHRGCWRDAADSAAAGVLLHGRGATALSILDLGDAINRPDVAWVAPQARGNTWYPNRFLAPIESNEPWLSSAWPPSSTWWPRSRRLARRAPGSC